MGRALETTSVIDEPLRFPDAPEHPGIAQLVEYWEMKRGDRAMPDRADIIPGEIASLLRHLIICEVVDGGADFRTRIFGTALVELVGEERTGKLLSEFGAQSSIPTRPERVRDRWFEIARRVHALGRPVFISGRMINSARPYIAWHAVACPLTAGGTTIEQVVGAMMVVR